MSKMVWVELDAAELKVMRIFKSKSAAGRSGMIVALMSLAVAVSAIRHHIWRRSEGYCEMCATPVLESNGHMHERKHRGQGGEISMENSVFICPPCHRREHADRTPKFSRKRLTNNPDSGTL